MSGVQSVDMTNTPKKALEGIRALLCVPSYGPIDPACQKDLRVAMMTAVNHGLHWAGDASPDKMGYALARNSAAQALLDGADELADGIMWVDSDIRMKPTDIASLIGSAREYKADFVTGVYHQRAGRLAPVFYEYDRRRKSFRQVIDYPENAFSPMGGCGFGFVWTSRAVIEGIANHKNFNPQEGWFPDKRDVGGFGEDLSFCYQAIQAGFQMYVNTGVQVGHTGDPRVIYRKDYLEELAKNPNRVEVKEEDREKVRWGKNAK